MDRRVIEATRTTSRRWVTRALVVPTSVVVTITFGLALWGPDPVPLGWLSAAVATLSVLMLGWVFTRQARHEVDRMDAILAESRAGRLRADNTGVWASGKRSLAIRWDREQRCFWVLGDVPVAGSWSYFPTEQSWRNFETLGQVVLDAERAGMVATPDVATTVLRARATFAVTESGWREAGRHALDGPRSSWITSPEWDWHVYD